MAFVVCHFPRSVSIRHTPRCAAKRKSSSRSKRPRSDGFAAPTPAQSSAPKTEPETDPAVEKRNISEDEQERLQKADRNGITLEHRLREEIAHPLRKPKLTLFGTLAFSATVGLFFAIARIQADPVERVVKNVLVDITAIVLFARLAYGQVLFGRRSLNSIAGKVQARDLGITGFKQQLKLPFGSSKQRLSMLLTEEIVIVAGRRADVLKYLGRAVASGDSQAVVAFSTDGNGKGQTLIGVVAEADTDDVADWVNWLADAIPPRRNVSLFRVGKDDSTKTVANDCVVEIGDPEQLPLPSNARRTITVDV